MKRKIKSRHLLAFAFIILFVLSSKKAMVREEEYKKVQIEIVELKKEVEELKKEVEKTQQELLNEWVDSLPKNKNLKPPKIRLKL